MPDRYIKANYGKTAKTANLGEWAFAYYPFLQRACCNFGCGIYNPNSIHADMFLGRMTPGIAKLEECFKEWTAASLVEIYKDHDGAPVFFLIEWFTDNSLRQGKPCIKKTPPTLAAAGITAEEWQAGNLEAINDKLALEKMHRQTELFQKPTEDCGNLPQNPAERKGKERKGIDSKKDIQAAINRVLSEYRDKIQPKTDITIDGHRSKVKARLKRWTEDQLLECVARFKGHAWNMAHNSKRGAHWFFKSDVQVEKWLNLESEKQRVDPRFEIAETPGGKK